MKALHIDQKTLDALARTTKMRSQTGIIPTEINNIMLKLEQITRMLERIETDLNETVPCEEEPHRQSSLSALNPLHHLRQNYEASLAKLRDRMITYLVRRYTRCLPNMNLQVNDFTDAMNQTVGDKGFNAEALENKIRELMSRDRELSLDHLQEEARFLVPDAFYNSTTHKDILDDNELNLILRVRTIVTVCARGEVGITSTDNDRIVALAKLSKVTLNNDDPVTAQSSIGNIFYPGWIDEQTLEHKIPVEPPMKTISLNAQGKLVIEYQTPEQAGRMAELLFKLSHFPKVR